MSSIVSKSLPLICGCCNNKIKDDISNKYKCYHCYRYVCIKCVMVMNKSIIQTGLPTFISQRKYECKDCIIFFEHLSMKKSLSIAIGDIIFDTNILDIIAMYAIGYILDCFNNKCSNTIIINNRYDLFIKTKSNYIYHYDVENTRNDAIILYNKNERIFCINCCLIPKILIKCQYIDDNPQSKYNLFNGCNNRDTNFITKEYICSIHDKNWCNICFSNFTFRTRYHRNNDNICFYCGNYYCNKCIKNKLCNQLEIIFKSNICEYCYDEFIILETNIYNLRCYNPNKNSCFQLSIKPQMKFKNDIYLNNDELEIDIDADEHQYYSDYDGTLDLYCSNLMIQNMAQNGSQMNTSKYEYLFAYGDEFVDHNYKEKKTNKDWKQLTKINTMQIYDECKGGYKQNKRNKTKKWNKKGKQQFY